MSRVFNFSAGPAAIPDAVLERVRQDIPDWNGTGMSVMEVSHRSKEFVAVAEKTEQDLRDLLAIPDSYSVLFPQGGATLQFAMVPLNLSSDGQAVDYVCTGSWSKKAIAEARKYCEVSIVANSEDRNFTYVPQQDSWQCNADAAYLHYCANETIGGVEFPFIPETGDSVEVIESFSTDRDTLTVWVVDSLHYKRDTLLMEVKFTVKDTADQYITQTDTLLYSYREPPPSKRKKDAVEGEEMLEVSVIRKNGNLDLNRDLAINLKLPLKGFNDSLIQMYHIPDTVDIPIPFQAYPDTMSLTRGWISAKWEPESKYRLVLLPGAVSSIYPPRCKIVSKIPPTSPAATRFTKRSSNCLGCLLRASPSVEPPSTSLATCFRIILKVLFSVCSAKIFRPWRRGRPASIIVENCLVKTTISLLFTFG